MLSSRTRVRGLVLAAICAAALGLAACGDDDDDDATTSTTTEAEATGETTETTEATEPTDESGAIPEDGDISEVLRAQLEAAGIQSDQADCVIDELESTLDEETLEELRDSQQPSPEVIDASTAAAQKCLTP